MLSTRRAEPTALSSLLGRTTCLGLVICLLGALLCLEGGNLSIGQDALKKWLPKLSKENTTQYTTDKRIIEKMLAELKLREEEISRKEQELEAARKSLEELEASLRERMSEIRKLQEDTKQLLKKAEAEKEVRISSLVALCGTMTSQNAALMLLELFKKDKELVTAVFVSLDKKRAASILDEITTSSPQTAAEITRRVGRQR